MEAQSLSSHQHSWWFSCFSLREKLARSHNQVKEPGSFTDLTFLVNKAYLLSAKSLSNCSNLAK